MTQRLYGIELRLTPMDSFYYVYREAGETFMTKEYVMNTALYYALGLFPSRFRTNKQRPRYLEDRDESYWGNRVYLSPAVALNRPEFQTRRFAVKTDQYRSSSERRSANFKETGHMKTIDPGLGFRSFAICASEEARDELLSTISPHCRLGKKMASTRVEVSPFEATQTQGEFNLGHPVGMLDVPKDEYDVLGNVSFKKMVPVNLLIQARLNGDHITIEPEWSTQKGQDVSLPTNAAFIAEREA
jgi:CRISPR type I-D-associated protein Csc1